jgi:hypothetical protein
MIVSSDQFDKIMEALNGGPIYWKEICPLAEQYIEEQLKGSGTLTLSGVDHHTSDPSATRTIIASLLIHACRDALLVDSAGRADDHRKDAATLKAALEVLTREARFFESLMVGVDDVREAITVDAPPGEPGPVRIQSRSARQTLYALATMASRFEETAVDASRDRKNIKLFHCLKRLFSEQGRYHYRGAPLPRPSSDQAHALYAILQKVMSEAAPAVAMPNYDKKEVRKHMKYQPHD